MTEFSTIGFIGLGVMGLPMCGHVARKSGAQVMALDADPVRAGLLADNGVAAAASVAGIAAAADLILLSLPGEAEVEAVCLGPDGIAAHGKAGQIVADLSTVPVSLARKIAAALAEKDIAFADAPVTRTAQAAVDATLSIMVGATLDLFARLEPVLRWMGSDVTRCGETGTGQAMKLLNNMVCFQTTNALAEALAMARRTGVGDDVFLQVLGIGTADSFALRNHCTKSMIPGTFATGTYSTRYAIKDAGYCLKLAEDTGVDARGGRLAMERLRQADKAGFGVEYYPVIYRVVDPTGV